ncbi:MAG: shikimate kinase [Bacteroidia bacterium]|nr:MAG: shikimate kinase [Bacteroidia bacterium]
MKRHLAFTGFMGSGKSTIAKTIAQQSGISFIDLDEYIENKEKTSISEIFESKGEKYFREIETKYLIEVLNIKENSVIALGGGTICFNNNLQIVKENCWLIALLPPLDILLERLWNDKIKRPLLKNISTKEELKIYIQNKLNERMPFYLQADWVVQK